MPRNIAAEPDPVDLYVGAQIRKYRIVQGLSQDIVAVASGVTFQQMQKYEQAGNRVSASRLHKISKALRVPMVDLLPPPEWDGQTELAPAGNWNSATLNSLYAEISRLSLAQRKAMLVMAKTLATSNAPAEPAI